MNLILNISKSWFLGLTVITLISLYSCSDDDTPIPPPVVEPEGDSIVVNTSVSYQEMIGFGGALTWYSDRVYSSSKKEEIYQLMFEDLGLDILRLKNWYYPENYPVNKSPDNMLTTGDEIMFNATNEFYAKAKEYNPEIEVLLSAWGPPPSLKSNDHLREGTLKRDDEGYMYAEYAQWWVDALDHITFDPEYISIQNEPSYTNPGWTTCMWRPTETTTNAGYESAFDSVYNRIKDRPQAPVMIGPESENISAFINFAPVVKDKDYCPIYAWHPYNFNESTSMSTITSSLRSMYSNFSNKPNIMTEYSTLSWFKTARFIQQTLIESHTSAYIYWELMWGNLETKDQAMIYMNSSGEYTVNPFFHLIKHYAKYIDKGYKRVDVTSSQESMEISGFINPAGDQLTLILINSAGSASEQFEVKVKDHEFTLVHAFQSREGNYYDDLTELDFSENKILFPSSSITTMVFELN
ncbi:MAG: hypothetical protein ACNS60_11805 [Candidatus Cyclobacteriaceae bacterium M2_1C_046]